MMAAALVAILAALPIVMLPDAGRLGVKLAKVAERLWLPDDALLGWADNAHGAYEDAVESRRSHVYVLLSSLLLLLVIGPYLGIRIQARRRREDVRSSSVMAVGALLPIMVILLGGGTPLLDVAELKGSVRGAEALLEEERSYLDGQTDGTSQGLITGLNDVGVMSQSEFASWVAATFPEEHGAAISEEIQDLTPAEWTERQRKLEQAVARMNVEFESLAELESERSELEALLEAEVDDSHELLSTTLWMHGSAALFGVFGVLVVAALGAPSAAAYRARLRIALVGLLAGSLIMPLLFKAFDVSLSDGFQPLLVAFWLTIAVLCGLQILHSRLAEEGDELRAQISAAVT